MTGGLAQLGVQEAWDYLDGEVKSLTEEFIPTAKGGKTRKRKPLWFDEKALLKVKLKRAAFQRYLQTREGRDYVLYTRARNQAKSACRRALKDFEKQVARSAKSNPKAFFAYVNSKLRTKETVADLRDTNGRKATSDTGKAGTCSILSFPVCSLKRT